MIFGIGVDMVKISRMQGVLDRWGDRFIRRVFTEDEIHICSGRAFPAASFGLRFAAKEAFSKALGLGMTNGLRWRDIEVAHQAGGRPVFRVHGTCAGICREKGITGMHVSLSDEGDYGVAMVLLEKTHETG